MHEIECGILDRAREAHERAAGDQRKGQQRGVLDSGLRSVHGATLCARP
jgi:hypothetical protein